MAVSKNFLEKINDITECPICCETFKDPRVLPCIHTFCLKCIEKYGETKQPGQEMPCPLCRLNFVVLSGGFSNFPKNAFLVKLIEAQKSQETKSQEASKNEGSKYCDVCLSTSEQKESEINCANNFCVECQESMCELCSKHHRGMKISKQHKIVSLEDSLNHTQSTEPRKVACDQHPNKELEIYCACCQHVGCLKCFAELHQSHECYDVGWAADEMISVMTTDLCQVQQLIVEVDEKFEWLNKNMQSFAYMTTDLEQGILQKRDELMQLLTRDVQKLLGELNAIKAQELKRFETIKDELEMRKVHLESFKRYSKGLIDQGIAADVARNADDLHLKAFELCKQLSIKLDERSLELDFRQADLKMYAAEGKQRNIIAAMWLKWRGSSSRQPLSNYSAIPLRQHLKAISNNKKF